MRIKNRIIPGILQFFSSAITNEFDWLKMATRWPQDGHGKTPKSQDIPRTLGFFVAMIDKFDWPRWPQDGHRKTPKSQDIPRTLEFFFVAMIGHKTATRWPRTLQ
jgi:hypothetical protein